MRRYSLCVVLLVLTLNNYAWAITEAQLKSAAKLLRKSCQPKTKVTSESIDNMHKGIWDDAPETQCYALCILSMYKLVDKEGRFDEEVALKQVEMLPKPRQAPILKSAENCKGSSDEGNDKCGRAYSLLKCVYFDNPDNYFAP